MSLHLGSIGLVLDMVGVSILFFVVIDDGERVVRVDEFENQERLRRKKTKETKINIGYALILVGFAFQVVSTERGINRSSSDKLHLGISQPKKKVLVDTSRLGINQLVKAKKVSSDSGHLRTR